MSPCENVRGNIFQKFVSAMKPHQQRYRRRKTRAVTHRFISILIYWAVLMLVFARLDYYCEIRIVWFSRSITLGLTVAIVLDYHRVSPNVSRLLTTAFYQTRKSRFSLYVIVSYNILSYVLFIVLSLMLLCFLCLSSFLFLLDLLGSLVNLKYTNLDCQTSLWFFFYVFSFLDIKHIRRKQGLFNELILAF